MCDTLLAAAAQQVRGSAVNRNNNLLRFTAIAQRGSCTQPGRAPAARRRQEAFLQTPRSSLSRSDFQTCALFMFTAGRP